MGQVPLDSENQDRGQESLLDWLPAFEAIAPSFVELDGQDQVVRTRGDCANLLGRADSDLIGTSFTGMLHERDRPLWQLVRDRLKRATNLPPFPIRIVLPDGKIGAVDITAARVNGTKKGMVQLAVARYHGQLSLEPAKRPPSSRAREFKKEDFTVLAERLAQYAEKKNENPAVTLMRLAGVSGTEGQAQPSGSEGLWAAHKLLTDAASEQAAKLAAETTRKGHEDREKSEEKAASVAQDGKEMKAAVRSAYQASSDTNYVTVAGEDGISEAEAVKAAVYAMKQAANSERAVTMKALTGGYERRLEKVRNQLRVFKKIVVQEKFDVALQPIMDLKTGEVHHFEALARFDKDFYSGSPFEFMCFAEDVGVIHEFDLAMTLKVVSLLKRIRRIGFDTNIAVNISGRSIQSQAFLRHFFRILEDCADVRAQLSFELTESSQIDDLETTNRVLSRIRDFGHKVALDDFGAGAAGLQYLRVLKVDYVKIDGIYVRKALEDKDNRAFLRSIAQLCDGLGIQTIGECIEVNEQEQFLSSIGIGYGQGWLYGKPMPVDEALTTFLS
ncbi:MAG: EAL domain-containing protein [Kordiimonadaceae bacterium]|nr:EAL domain-containing protein [Kordiimonadaceae bacterium]MBO6570508.1 EAL domain-containing protein [Kordiimonadaceae bacterium]MBO6966373.1 EAL domain-containing protein [Kordiimonadaceae bacterium]